MDKKIKVVELVNKYRNLSNDELKRNMIAKYVPTNTYLSYDAKCFLADKIVENAVLENNVVKMDSALRYSLYVLSLIDNYTQIEINAKEWNLTEYDMLEESGIFDVIIGTDKVPGLLPAKEVSAFTTILNMKVDDAVMNNPTQKDIVLAMMKMSIPNMNDVMANMDEEQFGKILEMVGKQES